MENEMVLWGKHSQYAGGAWIKIDGGTLAQCRTAQNARWREGWTWFLVIPKGAHPEKHQRSALIGGAA